MDRRRFQAAHLKYACIQMTARYPDAITSRSIAIETDTLDTITPALFGKFEARYAGLSSYMIVSDYNRPLLLICHFLWGREFSLILC